MRALFFNAMSRAMRFAGVNFFQGGFEEIFARHERIDHPVFQRLFRDKCFSSEDDVERFRQVY